MLAYLLYKCGQFLALVFPLRVGYWISDRVADLKRLFSPRERSAIYHNLKIINPQVSPRELNRLTIETFRYFSRYLVEFFKFSQLKPSMMGSFISLVGAEHIDRVLQDGRGGLLLSAHLGNWELGAVCTTFAGYSLNVVARSHKDSRVDTFFVHQRARMGVNVIPLGSAFKKCLRQLKNNELLALLGDRDFSNNSIDMEFFGHTASFPKGPALVALAANTPLLPTFMIRTGAYEHTLIIEPPIYADESLDNDDNVRYMLTEWIKVFERYVREYPNQLFIFEKIWQ